MSLAAALGLFDQFKKCYDAGNTKLDECQRLLGQLKVGMLSFTSLVRRPPLAALAAPRCA